MPEPEEDRKCTRIGIDCPPPQKQDGGLAGVNESNQKKADILKRKYPVSFRAKISGTNKESEIIINVSEEPLQAWVEENPDTKVNALVVGYKKGKKEYFDVNNYGMVELPADDPNALAGQYTFDGYVIYKFYNRNDQGKSDQWGKAEHIAGLINAIIEYRKTYPDDLLNIGDMRSPKNDRVPATGTSLHHANYGAIDIRPLGKGGSFQGNFTDTRHDIERSKAFIKAMGNNGFTIAIVGKLIIKELKSASNEKITVITDSGKSVHHDHYHFHIKK